jgi:hypothetical protein
MVCVEIDTNQSSRLSGLIAIIRLVHWHHERPTAVDRVGGRGPRLDPACRTTCRHNTLGSNASEFQHWLHRSAASELISAVPCL